MNTRDPFILSNTANMRLAKSDIVNLNEQSLSHVGWSSSSNDGTAQAPERKNEMTAFELDARHLTPEAGRIRSIED